MSRLSRTLGGALAAAVVAGTTVTGAASAPADAASATATYSCASPLPGLPAFEVPASFSLPGLPTQLPIGVPTSPVPVTGTLTLPATLLAPVFALLGGTLQAVSSTVLAPVGAGAVGVALQSGVTTVAAGTTTLVSTLHGVLPSFTPDQPGTQGVALPTTIDLRILGGLLGPLGITCTLEGSGGPTPVVCCSWTVTTSASTLSARTTKVTKGRKPAVRVDVTVTTPGTTTFGTVSATEAGQPVGEESLYGGVATFGFTRLARGTHTVRFSFAGSSVAAPAEQTITFTVPKAEAKGTRHAKGRHHRPRHPHHRPRHPHHHAHH